MKICNLDNLKRAFSDNDCNRILVKFLAPNDNSKNQIYLGKDFSVINILPISNVVPDNSSIGRGKKERLKSTVKFGWIDENISFNDVNIILYPKYPEVRISGLLKAKTASDEIRELVVSRDEGRLLFLGVNTSGGVVGYCSGKTDKVTSEYLKFQSIHTLDKEGVFQVIHTSQSSLSSKEIIKNALKPIVSQDWIKSQRLDKYGNLKDCHASNCGGYTLEAALDIIPNASSAPDYHGWEVKQFGVSSFQSVANKVITLMTSEPDGGFYKNSGVNDFLIKYGYEDRKSPLDRINFGGVHKAQKICKKTGLMLKLDGYDINNPSVFDIDGAICLVDKNDDLAASWTFAGLFKHWQRKHAKAVYLRSISKTQPYKAYSYSPIIKMGVGTSFQLFLKALAKSEIYYDPAVKMEGISSKSTKTKRRSQFRIKSNSLVDLYSEFESVKLL